MQGSGILILGGAVCASLLCILNKQMGNYFLLFTERVMLSSIPSIALDSKSIFLWPRRDSCFDGSELIEKIETRSDPFHVSWCFSSQLRQKMICSSSLLRSCTSGFVYITCRWGSINIFVIYVYISIIYWGV
jgi:hypothetical protein